MRVQCVSKLIVKYNSRVVGYLAELKDGRIAFQYDSEWVKDGFSISPFSLPLTDKVYINEKDTFNGLFGVFWDTLPDGWGELVVRRMLNKYGINFDKLTPLQKLSIINRNGLGALEYEPHKDVQKSADSLSLDQIAQMVQAVLNDEDKGKDLDKIFSLGGSSGGARPKAHKIIGREEWIVKFPCLIDPIDIGPKEFEANHLAEQCGINVNQYKLFPSVVSNGYFGAKRFDRINKQKVHMISLCALLETSHRVPNLDYGHLFQVIESICVDKNDLYEAFKRMCFNVYYKNRDDHGKNFSFLYDEELKGYKLSPAYDLTSTPNKSEHEMTVNSNGTPNDNDLLAIAKEFKLSLARCKQIMKAQKQILT